MTVPKQRLASRIAGWRSRRRGPVALVLSGGGPLGAVQVGQIQALFMKGITPEALIGVSVGALNAALVARDPSMRGALHLQDVWMKMRRDDFFPGGKLISALSAIRRGSHVFSSAGLRRLIEQELGGAEFEDLPVPVQVVATSLESGEEVWFNSGPMLEPLLASCALPGIFPPVEIDGVPYIDGGVANNIPLSRAISLGASRVYVLNVHSWFQQRPLNRPHDFLMHGYLLARAQRYRQDLESLNRHAEVIEFPPIDVGYVAFTDLTKTAELIESGFSSAMEFLESETTGASGPRAVPAR